MAAAWKRDSQSLGGSRLYGIEAKGTPDGAWTGDIKA